MRLARLSLIAIAAVLAVGCSSGPKTNQAVAPAEQQQTLHAHGSTASKFGLSPAVVDDLMEVTDSAVIKDGKLVEVDLPITLDGLHGSLYAPKEGLVLITIDEKVVAWSEKPTDYPVIGQVQSPVRYVENRLRMPAEDFTKLYAMYFPQGKIAVKDGKLYLTTGR